MYNIFNKIRSANKVGVCVFGLSISSSIYNYFSNKKKFTYEQLKLDVESETVSVDPVFDALINVFKDYATLVTETMEEVKTALQTTYTNNENFAELPKIKEVPELKEEPKFNVFSKNTDVNNVPDLSEFTPIYVISVDEYYSNTEQKRQVTLYWFEEEKTLTDEEKVPIYNLSHIIGDPTTTLNFGYGSKDKDVVYIRNHNTKKDYQVIKQYEPFPSYTYDDSENFTSFQHQHKVPKFKVRE